MSPSIQIIEACRDSGGPLKCRECGRPVSREESEIHYIEDGFCDCKQCYDSCMAELKEEEEVKPMTLDEFKDAVLNNLHELCGYCGHCGKNECWGKQAHSKLPSGLPTQQVLDAINSVTDTDHEKEEEQPMCNLKTFNLQAVKDNPAEALKYIEELEAAIEKRKGFIVTEEQRKVFTEACEPLMEWLADNCHPHVKVLVDSTRAELVEGVATHHTEKFIKD